MRLDNRIFGNIKFWKDRNRTDFKGKTLNPTALKNYKIWFMEERHNKYGLIYKHIVHTIYMSLDEVVEQWSKNPSDKIMVKKINRHQLSVTCKQQSNDRGEETISTYHYFTEDYGKNLGILI